MQTNYMSRLWKSIRNPILIGATIATFAVMPYVSGCQTESQRIRSEYDKKFNSLSPEKQAEWIQGDYEFMRRQREEQRKRDQASIKAAGDLSRYNAKMQQQTQQNNNRADKDANIIDGITERVGADMSAWGLEKAIKKYGR